jgi:single-strand DNA-binding protein
MTIHAHFVGNVGKDPRFNTVGQQAVLNFSVGASDGFGDKKVTIWIDCALWGKQAERLSAFIVKGSKLAVHGTLSEKEFKRNDGTMGKALACRVSDIDLLDKKGESAESVPSAHDTAKGNGFVAQKDPDDDIPF